MAALEYRTSSSENSPSLPAESTRKITGLASGPRPRETVRNVLPVSGFTARSLIRISAVAMPNIAAIFSSIFSTFKG